MHTILASRGWGVRQTAPKVHPLVVVIEPNKGRELMGETVALIEGAGVRELAPGLDCVVAWTIGRSGVS